MPKYRDLTVHLVDGTNQTFTNVEATLDEHDLFLIKGKQHVAFPRRSIRFIEGESK